MQGSQANTRKVLDNVYVVTSASHHWQHLGAAQGSSPHLSPFPPLFPPLLPAKLEARRAERAWFQPPDDTMSKVSLTLTFILK